MGGDRHLPIQQALAFQKDQMWSSQLYGEEMGGPSPKTESVSMWEDAVTELS